MTFTQWLVTGQGATLVAALAGFLAAAAAYFKTRAQDDRIIQIHHNVNGETSRKNRRVAELENLLADHGIPIPPHTDMEQDNARDSEPGNRHRRRGDAG